MAEQTGWTAERVTANRSMKYTNSLAPLSLWKFRIRLPDGSGHEFEAKLMDGDVPYKVDELNVALGRLDEVYSGIDRDC